MTLWLDVHDPFVRDLVGTAIAEPVAPIVNVPTFTPTTAEGRHEALDNGETLHGTHCYEDGVLVCGWPEQHR